MQRITVKDRADHRDRFAWCRDSMLISFFEGITGEGFAQRERDPAWAAVRTGDFCFCAGRPEEIAELAEYIDREMSAEAVVIPESEEWFDALQECGLALRRVTRYHTRLPESGLDERVLREISEGVKLRDGVRIVRAGEREYEDLQACEWEGSFVSNFHNLEDFLQNGFACCIYVGDELASAASTFGCYSAGWELQIATAPKFRRQGFAAAAAAGFLLECMRRGKRPHWDAANLTSVRIAQKLGFEYDGEYFAIEKNAPNFILPC